MMSICSSPAAASRRDEREEPLLQLTDREAARVDDLVGQLARPRQPALLFPDAALHPRRASWSGCRWRVSLKRDTRLASMPRGRATWSGTLAARRARHAPLDRGRRIAGTDVEHEGNVPIARLIGVPEVEEAVEQLRRQVVDAVEAEVLEQLRGLALARAREAT